jgi:acyl-CoA thioesterase-1
MWKRLRELRIGAYNRFDSPNEGDSALLRSTLRFVSLGFVSLDFVPLGFVLLAATGGAALPSNSFAQAAAQPAAASQAQPAPAPAPATLPKDDYWTKHNEQLVTDFGWLAKFRDANAALPAPAAGESRVVFMGDSITEGWHFAGPDGSFPGKPYINRGISGQTTPQMLVRFRQDVIALKPKVVVIFAGTNDIAGNTGPMTPWASEDNIASMADLATANGIKVVLCSILPAADFGWHKGLEPAPKIVALNKWIKGYAADQGYEYVDFHTAMKDEHDGLPANLSKDGVHPTAAGYAVMTPLVEAGIEKALAEPQ